MSNVRPHKDMYQRAKQLETPSDSRQRMWRYMSTSRLQELLELEQLYFRRVSRFGDGLEGRLTRRSRDRLRSWFVQHGSAPHIAEEEMRVYEGHSNAFFANCWHMRNHESYLMWRAYATKGVAVQTTFERIQASFDKTPHTVDGGVVSYVDFEREHTGLGQVFTHVTTKDLPYEDEREFRLLLWTHDPANVSLQGAGDGALVNVDTRMLIERVVRNPFQASLPHALSARLEELEIPYDDSGVKYLVESQQSHIGPSGA